MVNINELLRPHLLAVQSYKSARDEYKGSEGIFLDANENSFGTVGDGAFNRYPDPYQSKVRLELSRQKKIAPEKIFLGNGSDEIIDLLIRAFCEPGEENILVMPPTFGMYNASASVNGIELIEAPLTEDFQIDLATVNDSLNPETKIIFICSPNNPTGNLMKESDILAILNQFKGIVVVDEAYIDFSIDQSIVSLVEKFPNLLVLQTFSKAWGMASLRLGIAYANEAVIDILNKIKMPYNVNGLTQEYAYKALLKLSEKNRLVEEILTQKEWLKNELFQLGIVKHIYPSDANFFLVRFDNPNEIYRYLIDKQIVTRNRSNLYLCEGCLRITVGTALENQKLIEVLKGL